MITIYTYVFLPLGSKFQETFATSLLQPYVLVILNSKVKESQEFIYNHFDHVLAFMHLYST